MHLSLLQNLCVCHMAMLLLGHLHIFWIAQWMFSDQWPYVASYQCSPNYHGFDFNLAFRWLYFHQVPSVNNDNSTFPTFEFVRQSYISVTIWLSNKECLKLLLLSISSSRQCNGNVMVNLTQNVRFCPISLPPQRQNKFETDATTTCSLTDRKNNSVPKQSKDKHTPDICSIFAPKCTKLHKLFPFSQFKTILCTK